MLKVGDTIKFHDKDEMVEVMKKLAKEDIFADFMYEKDGEQGLWLIIEKVGA